MIVLLSPAPLSQVFALFAADPIAGSLAKFGANPRAQIVAHVAACPSWVATWHPDNPWRRSEPVAAAGLIPDGDAFEAWFVCSPRAKPALRDILRATQLTWRELAQDGPIKIRARVGPDWRPGQRIARLLGMTRQGRELGMDVWERQL